MKIKTTLLALALAVCPAAAQVTMRDMLKQMPGSLVPYLTENAVLDFIDFVDSNMKAEVSNALDGKSELKKLTDNYALLQPSESYQIEMRLLDTLAPVDSVPQILCLIRTYGTDMRESTMEFYNTHWQKLPADQRVRRSDGKSVTSDGMYVATLGETETTLSLLPQHRLDFPANESQKEISEPQIILKWDGEKFNEY